MASDKAKSAVSHKSGHSSQNAGSASSRNASRNATLAKIIAHRGASGDAPENTLGALSLAAEHGASCVEIDVSISADNIPFVHHDDTLERCTSGSGLLSALNASELDKLTAGKGMAGYENEPLPRLSAVIELLVEHNLGLNLEIKPQTGLEERTCRAISSMVLSQWPERLPLVFSSFSELSLAYVRDMAPDIPRGLLVESIPANVEELVERYRCQNVHCHGKQLDRSAAVQIKSLDLGLYCYTVNSSNDAKTLFDFGVDGIFTDYPKRLLSELSI